MWPVRRGGVEPGATGEVQAVRRQHAGGGEGITQHRPPEEIARQQSGIAAVDDIGGNLVGRVGPVLGQHAALGIEHIDRDSGAGEVADDLTIGRPCIIDHQRIEAEQRNVHRLLILRDQEHVDAARGIDVFLVPQYEQAVDVPLLGLDALVVNYARPTNREIVGDFARSGIAVYVLDTEGGVLAKDGPNAPDKIAAYVVDSGYAGLLAGYFFWGPVLRDAFAAAGVLPPDRLHLTGCPRFDLDRKSTRLNSR